MTQEGAPETGAAGRSLESAHKALLERRDLQFTFEEAERPVRSETPDWLRALFDAIAAFFEALSPLLVVLFWAAVAAAVLGIVYLIAREAGALDIFRGRKAAPAPAVPLYQPEIEVAQALLADADALAAEGRYEEAVHVLLLRSVEDMRRWRPRAIRPSLTSRDLSELPVLPATAREAFSAMALLVETSLFGGRRIGREGFEQSRKAYADFALPQVWA